MPRLGRTPRIYAGAVQALRAYRGSSLAWIEAITTSPPTALAAHYTAERVQGETLLYDDFNRADGALGSVPGPGDPVAWSVLSGTWTISGNKASGTSGGGFIAAVVEAGTADLVVAADVTAASSGGRAVVARAIDNSNFIYADVHPSNLVRIRKVDGGAASDLVTASFTVTPSQQYGVRLVAKGDQLRVFVDGVLKLTHTLSGADYTKFGAITKAGLHSFISGDSALFDNFSVRTLAPSTDLAAAVDTFDRSTAAEIVDLNDGSKALRIPDSSTNNGASTPNPTAVTSTIETIIWTQNNAPTTDNGEKAIIQKFGGGAARTFRMQTNLGKPYLRASQDGSAEQFLTFSAMPDTRGGVACWIRAVVTDTGSSVTARMDYSFDPKTTPIDSINWTNANGTLTFPVLTGLYSGAGHLRIGNHGDVASAPALFGKARVIIDGTVVASPDFTAQAAGTTSFVDSAGNTWTIAQSHGSIGSTETGEAGALAYTVSNGTATITNGRLTISGAGTARSLLPSVITDLDASADIQAGAAGPGITFRDRDASNFLVARVYSDRVDLAKRVSTIFTVLASASLSLAGSTPRVRTVAVGDRIWVYVNGVLVITHTLSGADHATFSGASYNQTSVFQFGGSATFDNFRISRPPLVACWPDLSGKHRHAVQTVTAKQPVLLTNIKNGRAVARFTDALAQEMTTPAGTVARDHTLMATARGDGTDDYIIRADQDTRTYLRTGGFLKGNPQVTVGTFVNDAAWHAYVGISDGGVGTARQDGVDKTTTPNYTPAASNGGLNFGRFGGAGLTGDIGELVIANADLEATGELTAVEAYLLRRWT